MTERSWQDPHRGNSRSKERHWPFLLWDLRHDLVHPPGREWNNQHHLGHYYQSWPCKWGRREGKSVLMLTHGWPELESPPLFHWPCTCVSVFSVSSEDASWESGGWRAAQLPVVGGREGTQTLLSPQPPLPPFLIYLGSRKAWGRKPTLSCPSPSQAIISPEMN